MRHEIQLHINQPSLIMTTLSSSLTPASITFHPNVHWMKFSFGDIEIDTHLYGLRRNGKLVSTEPLIFDLLAFLIKHTDEFISRDDLI